MTGRILVVLLFVGFSLMTFFIRSSSALGRMYAAEVNDPAASATLPIPEESAQVTDLPGETPSPEQTETQNDLTTPVPTEPTATEAGDLPTPTPTVSPEEPTASEEPTEVCEAQFTGESGGVRIRVNTMLAQQPEAALALSLSRVTLQSDETAFEHYRSMLAEMVTSDQVEQYIAYELRYLVDGTAIESPQSVADITLSDNAQAFAPDQDSIHIFYLPTGADQLRSATARIENGALLLSLPVCPSVLFVEQQQTAEATPLPESTPDPEASVTPSETTPEPSPSVEPVALYEYENDGLYVSGSPASSEVLPEGAVLSAERITSENSPERYAQYAEMLQALYNTDFPIAFNAYDISFHADGQEIEPVGDVVNVTIRDNAFTQAVEDPLVYHVIDEQSGEPALQEIPAAEDSSTGADQVVFSADSFSVFIVLANGSTLTLADNSGLTYKIIQTAADTFTNTSYYNSSQKLGIAGNFHIVAFNTATLSAHTNGNVLAKNLYAGSNFGTNGLTDELSYVQNYMQVNGVSASNNTHVLAIGYDNTVSAFDNGNAFGINGVKLDRPKNLWQDQSTTTLPFVDLAAVKSSSESLSSSLAGNSAAYTESHLSTTGGSCDLSYINLTNPDKVGFFNITASALSSYNYFGVKGFSAGHSGTVIINVDCTGVSSPITLPESRMYVDGTAQNLTEVTNFVNGRVLWNLVNCTTTVTTRLLYASLLAPDATVNVGQNLNGTVIGNNVTISAESHRDDFIGSVSNGVTVTGNKVWSDYGTGSPANTSVTFQLYRSTDGGTTRTAYGTPVTLNSTTGWTYSWTELPTGSLYTIVETAVTQGSTDVSSNYAASYSTDTGVSSGSITVTNQYLYALPSTGGIGVARLYTLGGLLLLMAGIILYRRKMRKPAGYAHQ